MSSRLFNPAPTPAVSAAGWHAEGPWFRDDHGRKVTLRGVTYGPFRPNAAGEPWPEPDQLQADIAHIAALGFNVIRIYEAPSPALLEACAAHDLRVLAGVAWTQHVDFCEDEDAAEEARQRVRDLAASLARQPQVAGLMVGNEVERTLVRWMGPERVLAFIEDLVAIAREAAPGLLVGYASYPCTECLVPRNASFVAFNVFLEHPEDFRSYVQHLMNVAAGRPLIISEFGLDTATHGEAAQAATRAWQERICREAGVAGHFWFSYTDEWHRGGEEVTGWDFGLVTRDRRRKHLALQLEKHAASDEATAQDRISVIVCTRNGAATLRGCLDALSRQTYPDYEVLVIDDGSTDSTPEIVRDFDQVRCIRQEHAGLSAARNLGMRRATGTLLAYTDDDCLPDEDWLRHVSRAFQDPHCVAAGGPNLPPRPRNRTEACVALAPGAPIHVLLNDSEAEHLPGCNLVIRKTALQAIDGFREEFRTAGDDVDVCWRLQAAGGKLRYVPGALVWHHRRFTVSAYFRQQSGYGNAESMLVRRYPHRFAWLGGARWRGALYDSGEAPAMAPLPHTDGVPPRHALFQTLRVHGTPTRWDWMTGLPWLLVALLLTLAGALLNLDAAVVGGAMLVAMLGAAWRRSHVLVKAMRLTGRQVDRWLLWFLCLGQPLVRDWGRLHGMFSHGALPSGDTSWPWRHLSLKPSRPCSHWSRETFWNEDGVGSEALLQAMRTLAPAHDMAWHETEGPGPGDTVLRTAQGRHVGLAVVTEYHERGRRLTRVACGLKHRWWLDGLQVLLLLAIPLAGLLPWHPFWIAPLLPAFLAGWRAHGNMRAIQSVRALVLAAARACRLARGRTPVELAPGEMRESGLAPAGQSGEAYPHKP